MLTRRRTGEDGVALVLALSLMVLVALLTVAIFMGAQSSVEGTRNRTAGNATELLARDAGTALVSAFNALRAGEQNRHAVDETLLDQHARRLGSGARAVRNSSLPWPELRVVDGARVPRAGQVTMQRDIGGGLVGYWQVYSVKAPSYGVTRGGRVLVYVRAWVASGTSAQRPVIYRLEFRPTWFADYQLLFDGPAVFGSDAVISGRVHSNGFEASYYDQYDGMSTQISMDRGASCTGSAVISTARGRISGCGRHNENTGREYNLLRARTAIETLRNWCTRPALRPTIEMSCPSTTTTSVRLRGTDVWVNGARVSARFEGDLPGNDQGAVVIAPGNVDLSGTLSSGARALVIAAAPSNSSDYGRYGAPSIYIRGSVGAGTSRSSTFGAIAEGDIVLLESAIRGSATMRGAFLTLSGLMSHDQQYRLRVPVAGGTMGGRVRIEGSIVGHFPPIMYSPHNNAGFSERLYTWNDSLFDNPPPMYPTAADWEVTGFNVANLDCFTPTGALRSTVAECG